MNWKSFVLIVVALAAGYNCNTQIAFAQAPVALYRDPVHDGAADPVVIWNRAKKAWWMFYTSRRADMNNLQGVSWNFGTRIGIAESFDGGIQWRYVGLAHIPYGTPNYSFWAPEVIDIHGTYHMFLTIVPGTYISWKEGTRYILHLTSKDLLHWKPLAEVTLPTDRAIDPCMFRMPNGEWRLWYKNVADHSKIYFSDSTDLKHWTAKGIAIRSPGEGPVVFQWHRSYWLIEDAWAGLAVFRSDDLTSWTRQSDNLLRTLGTRSTDRARGSHPDVVIDSTGRAWLFYFTQQSGDDEKLDDPSWARRTVIHVTELHESNGVLIVDRNSPATIDLLPPPQNKKSDGLSVFRQNREK